MNVFATGFFAAGFFASGFFASGDEPPIEVPVVQTGAPSSSAGGVEDDSGTGYVWKDHGWVKATKFARVGISAQYPVLPVSSAFATLTPVVFSVNTPRGLSSSKVRPALTSMLAQTHTPAGTTNANSETTLSCTTLITKRYNGACETIAMDELMVILEMAG